MQLIRYLLSYFYLIMFRTSLCPSSGGQDRVLLHMVFCTVTGGREKTHIPSSGHNTPDLTDIRNIYHSNTTVYTYTHGTHINTRPYTNAHEIPTMFTSHYSTQRFYGPHLMGSSALLLQCRTPYAVIHGLDLLMMGIMMPETCWTED